MSGSSDRSHQAGVLSGSLVDLTTPGVVVELDASEAERLGAFAEPALTAATAWEANGDLDPDDREVARLTDYAGQTARSIADQIRTDSAPWQKPWPPGERFMPYNPASGAGYHAINYIAAGACPGGLEPLLKPVAAIAGDFVTVTPLAVAVNGQPVAETAPLAQDQAGRSLYPVPPGSYRVTSGEVWVLSSHDPRSFDSRYFGPLPAEGVQGEAQPLWVLP